MMPVVPGLTDLSVLAHGGYATVYRAIQVSVAREVAVKVENRTLESEKDQRRFLREARAAGRMSSHPHVVDLIDVGMTEDGHPYMIMELCAGSYADRMKTKPLSPEEARDVGVKIADALADAHTLGVLHRDVKPANILITKFGEPALADFGLAVLTETRESSISLEMTPAFAAPELFHHGRPVPASDVYALCATLYALVSGRPARWRENHNPSLVSLVDMFAEPVPDIPGVPPDLIALLRQGMANDPVARPSAAELRDELSGVRRDPDPTMIMQPVTRDYPMPEFSFPLREVPPPPQQPRRPNRDEETTQPL
ncbi:MAG TPA: serine/threonine-protein kinase [Micromonosporaceae bacterium]|nr:serine/threonine-protein kinase [Micromonosporaceae bacterium]